VPVTHTFIQFDDREPILIGTPAMNVVPAAIVESAGGLAVEVLDHRVAIHPRHHAALHGLKSVEAGIRPHQQPDGPAPPTRREGALGRNVPLASGGGKRYCR
jgi:hypothetical protein